MALVLLNNVGQPYGQFDGYDNLASSLLGGEVATFTQYGVTGSDKHAKDIEDGYIVQGPATTINVRPVVTTTLTNSDRMLFLTDDGTTNYGTLFGTVVGGIAGQQVSGGAALGPNTMTGSGKVTLWQNTGMYGVTLDAVNTAADGLIPTSSVNLTVGSSVTFLTSGGKLTPLGSSGASTTVVGRLVEFSTGDTLVTTPRSLTRVGIAGGMLQFKYAVINWNPPSA